MAARRKGDPQPDESRRRPATTPDAREQQLIAMAVDAVEQRIKDGSASAQELVHYLKLGSSRERLEQARIKQENELLAAKREALAGAADMKVLFEDAIAVMRGYQGQEPITPEDDYDD